MNGDGSPPIAEYGLISDRRGAALVSPSASIDWCCMPHLDCAAPFARLLNWDRGGYAAIEVEGGESTRRYLKRTMVLVTALATPGGEAHVLDYFKLSPEGEEEEGAIVRIVEGVRGSVDFGVSVVPRFDYGAVAPAFKAGRDGVFSATGGEDGLLVRSEVELGLDGERRLEGRGTVGASDRLCLELAHRPAATLDSPESLEPLDPDEVDESLDATVDGWRKRGPDSQARADLSHVGEAVARLKSRR
jgi:GH15 family glucan-1,4-alpha-glucosidase